MKRHKWDWDFKCLNPTDFECLVELDISGQMMYTAFYKSLNKLNVERRNANLEYIQEFEAHPQYMNVLKTGTKKLLTPIFKEIGRDGIKIINWTLSKAIYRRRKTGSWRVFLTYTGNWVKE